MVFEENLNYDGQRGISNSFAIFFLRVVRKFVARPIDVERFHLRSCCAKSTIDSMCVGLLCGSNPSTRDR